MSDKEMPDNVVSFPSDDKPLLVCAACECMTMLHYADGAVECSNCSADLSDDNTEWRNHFTGPDKADLKTTEGITRRNIYTNPDFAKWAVFRDVEKMVKDGTAMLVVGYRRDAMSRIWYGPSTVEEAREVVERLEDVIDIIKKGPILNGAESGEGEATEDEVSEGDGGKAPT